MSNIRASVVWSEPTVFAGEEVECVITFKNIAVPTGTVRNGGAHQSQVNGRIVNGQRPARVVPLPASTVASVSNRPSISRNPSYRSQKSSNPKGKVYAPVVSISGAQSASHSRTPSIAEAPANGAVPRPGHAHKRSISILSIGSDGSTGSRSAPPVSGRPKRGHGRSASLQFMPRRPGSGQASPVQDFVPSRLSISRSATAQLGTLNNNSLAASSRRRSPGMSSAPPTPSIPNHPGRRASPAMPSEWKFPARRPSLTGHSVSETNLVEERSPITRETSATHRQIAEQVDQVRTKQSASPMRRVAKTEDTPRSSEDFYSLPNVSDETLQSDYHTTSYTRFLPKSLHNRPDPNMTPTNHQRLSDTLMMGYAQIMGSFTVDGALINQAPFEEVKRKGVVGGAGGGGVVGVEKTKRDSGLFGALGWGSIGESLSGMLSSGEMSSMKEMRSIANMKTVPLLSTPQSILFIDLHLSPGESRSYRYKFKLPRGLPPTHRGRAIKISYHLAIGTQRAGTSGKKQIMKNIEVPFRIFGSINSRGEILGHDLMSPYIILKDQAQTDALDEPLAKPAKSSSSSSAKNKTSQSSNDEFFGYVEKLLTNPRKNSSQGFLSPTDETTRRPSFFELGHSSQKEAIDLAILRSSVVQGPEERSNNRFDIARNGRAVSVISLTRPAYRLAESLTMILDFSKAQVPCYAAAMTLETSEKIDPAIAVRSDASVHRVTRKIHASVSQNALFAQRVAFTANIPRTATPSFLTSGVSLEWCLRVTFTTASSDADDYDEAATAELLESIFNDDRGVVDAAAERLPCETFEVEIPIRVYGASTGIQEGGEVGELAI